MIDKKASYIVSLSENGSIEVTAEETEEAVDQRRVVTKAM